MSDKFTVAQEMAVKHIEGPCMVLAGPGSGKTYTLINRILNLRKKGIPGREILVITFTKAAAQEMAERYSAASGDKSVSFGTFHSIFYAIVRWAYTMSPDAVLSGREQMQLMKKAASAVYIDWDEASEEDTEEELLQKVLEDVGRLKADILDPGAFQPQALSASKFFEVYENYEKLKRENGKLDFDDMLVYCYHLFTKYPEALKKWQKHYRYILVDEFQDINPVQYAITRLLAAPEDNLFIVGDDDQSIYGFRGSDPSILLNFQKDYPDAKKIFLDENFRSTRKIIDSCSRVIAHNTVRYDKKFQTRNGAGENVVVREVKDPREEAVFIGNRISDFRKAGVSYKDMAVLFRTNHYARDFFEYAVNLGIPIKTKERIPTLYDHFAVQDLLAYFRLGAGSRKREDFLKICNRPVRYIKRAAFERAVTSFEDLRIFYEEQDYMMERIDTFEGEILRLKSMTPYEAVKFIRLGIGYESYLVRYAKENGIEFSEIREKLDALEERAKNFDTLKDFLDGVERYQEARKESRMAEDDLDAVRLLTMHGAKGLEFKHVFVIGANEDEVPYKKAETPGAIEEERRIFYVALSRAKHTLCVTFVHEKSGKKVLPSRFVNELLFV